MWFFKKEPSYFSLDRVRDTKKRAQRKVTVDTGVTVIEITLKDERVIRTVVYGETRQAFGDDNGPDDHYPLGKTGVFTSLEKAHSFLSKLSQTSEPETFSDDPWKPTISWVGYATEARILSTSPRIIEVNEYYAVKE